MWLSVTRSSVCFSVSFNGARASRPNNTYAVWRLSRWQYNKTIHVHKMTDFIMIFRKTLLVLALTMSMAIDVDAERKEHNTRNRLQKTSCFICIWKFFLTLSLSLALSLSSALSFGHSLSLVSAFRDNVQVFLHFARLLAGWLVKLRLYICVTIAEVPKVRCRLYTDHIPNTGGLNVNASNDISVCLSYRYCCCCWFFRIAIIHEMFFFLFA